MFDVRCLNPKQYGVPVQLVLSVRNLIRVLFVAVLLGSLSRPAAASELAVRADRVVIIDGVIQQANLTRTLGATLLGWASDGSGEPVDIIINSPGGEITSGFLFLNLLEQVKTTVPVRCFVPELAASMAFQILVHCSERHTLNRAFLLWHRVRVQLGGMFGGATVTAPAAAQLAADLGRVDTVIFRELHEALSPDMPDRTISMHFEQQTLHVGMQLAESAPHFITSHAAIPGLYEALSNKQIPRSSSGVSDMLRRGFGPGTGGSSTPAFAPGTIIYLYSGPSTAGGTAQ